MELRKTVKGMLKGDLSETGLAGITVRTTIAESPLRCSRLTGL